MNFDKPNSNLGFKPIGKARQPICKRKDGPSSRGESLRLSHDVQENAGYSLSKWPQRPQKEAWPDFKMVNQERKTTNTNER